MVSEAVVGLGRQLPQASNVQGRSCAGCSAEARAGRSVIWRVAGWQQGGCAGRGVCAAGLAQFAMHGKPQCCTNCTMQPLGRGCCMCAHALVGFSSSQLLPTAPWRCMRACMAVHAGMQVAVYSTLLPVQRKGGLPAPVAAFMGAVEGRCSPACVHAPTCGACIIRGGAEFAMQPSGSRAGRVEGRRHPWAGAMMSRVQQALKAAAHTALQLTC